MAQIYNPKFFSVDPVYLKSLLPTQAFFCYSKLKVNSMDSYLRTHAQLVNGLRVVRGPNWNHGNQDGGEGCVGTVVEWKKTLFFDTFSLCIRLPNAFFGMVSVIWDSGIKGDYRIGYEGDFDLRVLDNSATGVEHELISCSHCCPGSNVIGILWHCEECDQSICSPCFFQDKHDQTHIQFRRYDTPNTDPISIVFDPLKKNKRFELKGIFQGAKVERGPNWRKRNEDVAGGVVGVGSVQESRNLTAGMVKVKWQNDKTRPYRLGANGKVDLQLVQVASGGFYHPEHLPVLKPAAMKFVTSSGGEIEFAVGDRVKIVTEDQEELKNLYEEPTDEQWISGTTNYFERTGIIVSMNQVRVVVQYQQRPKFFRLNPEVLLRLSHIFNEVPVWDRRTQLTPLKMPNKFHLVKNQADGIMADNPVKNHRNVLDNKNEILPCDRVEFLTRDNKNTQERGDLKSKMVEALIQAAANGQLKTVKELLSKFQIEINDQGVNGYTALHAACHNGHLETVKELYFMAKERQMTILEQQDINGRRAIHHAAEGFHLPVLAFLIKPDDDPNTKGADIDAQDKNKWTALHVAANAKSLQTVKLLVENGSDVNLQDLDYNTALHTAIMTKSYQELDIIIALSSSNNANLKLRNHLGFNPLCLAIAVKNLKAFDHLLKVGGEELATTEGASYQFTPLQFICFNGELQFAKNFLKYVRETFKNNGMDYFLYTFWGTMAPLPLAVKRGNYALVELLVNETGVNVIMATNKDCLPVRFAALKFKNLREEPDPITAPAIFKIHTELKEKNPEILISYPGLSMVCYLISTGCPWNKLNDSSATHLIKNIRIILKSYEKQKQEEPTDVGLSKHQAS